MPNTGWRPQLAGKMPAPLPPGDISRILPGQAVSKRETTVTVWSLMLVVIGMAAGSAPAQTNNVSVNPEADAFVRAQAPTANYGRAGSLAVAGVSATNGFGVPGGRADSLARFPLDAVVSSLDSTFGNHEWFVANASLRLYELGAPNNALFSRGVGAFEVRRLASGDNWQEGTGSPNLPTMDGVSFQDLPSLLDSAHDISLGVFTNNGVDGSLTLNLALAPPFVEGLRAGGATTLQFTPVNDSIGFTFLSRSDPRTDLRISLDLTVAAGPPPRISAIERISASQVAIRFMAHSNWTSVIQYSDKLSTYPGTAWLNHSILTPQPSNTVAEVWDTITNSQRFYRLILLP